MQRSIDAATGSQSTLPKRSPAPGTDRLEVHWGHFRVAHLVSARLDSRHKQYLYRHAFHLHLDASAGVSTVRQIAFVARTRGLGMGIRNAEMVAQIERAGYAVTRIAPRDRPRMIASFVRNLEHSLRRTMTHVCIARVRSEVIVSDVLAQLEHAKQSIDFIFCETTPLGYAAYLFSQSSGIPYVLDMHGLWGPEYAGEHAPSGRRHGGFLGRIEKEVAGAAAHVIVVSNRMKSYVSSEYGVPASRISVVPNGGFATSRRAEPSPVPRLIYAGNFSYWERPQDFVRMSQLAQSMDFRFVMAGDGALRRVLIRGIEGGGPSNIEYAGLLARDETIDLMFRSQVGVAPSTADLVRDVAWPVKVMDYMSCGLPVIVPRVGDWAPLVESYEAGVVTNRSDPAEFLEAARQLRDSGEWTVASHNAIELVKSQYLWQKVLSPLPGILDEVT